MKMTVDQALCEAKKQLEICDDDEMAKWIVETFDEAPPCGFEPFEVHDGFVVVTDANSIDVGGCLSPSEARSYAKMLLDGADAAEDESAAAQELAEDPDDEPEEEDDFYDEDEDGFEDDDPDDLDDAFEDLDDAFEDLDDEDEIDQDEENN